MRNKPAYSVESVDHALRLAVLLQHEGPLRVSEAAERLGVARSTAHRLLAMLVYRDFAVQTGDRRYQAGGVLRRPTATEPAATLRSVAVPHLRELVDRVGETANLMVLAGRQVRFVVSVECGQILRVGDREGKMLPAHLASGGRVLLARLSGDELDGLFGANAEYAGNTYELDEGTPIDRRNMHRALGQIRKQGFAVNNQATEIGVTAIGHAVGQVNAAVSLALPTARYAQQDLPGYVEALRIAAGRIEHELRVAGQGLAS
ncbi:IclR family transcriptional regulator [Amycolatopsis echigonensis]|uniref:IclR family transcriptional regulator n=1 Tax=Amycolatopsis echigonensis TaxID=2576905 RepID=A0A8E1W5S6_9PSEU|nr:IclR family transcriptional regulator [Amycolatopsis echigonensis]MBB2504412.1 IclR family transcriptional regulator [Amycolatopsis echigonensis]